MKRVFLIIICLPIYWTMAQNTGIFPENVTIRVDKTGVNTTASDFGPEFVENELWFSAFSEEGIARMQPGRTEKVFYKLYSAPVDADGEIRGVRSIRLPEISAGYHAGPVSWCRATHELYMTLSNFENPEIRNVVFRKANIPLKIILLKKSGNSWAKAGELPFNSSSYSVGHPAVSPTGDTLFFTSDIPGKGRGGADLYMAVRKDGNWGDMVNLGERINTSGDEMFPFLHNGRVLFFASNGKTDGKGGLDIYYSLLTENGFGVPKNLTELNSPEDDFGLIVHPDERLGYFVSRKPGGLGDDDIWKVVFADKEPEGKYELELMVQNKKTMQPMPGVKVVFNDGTSKVTGSDGMIRMELARETNYTATSDLEGYMNESVTFTTRNAPLGVIRQVIRIEKVEVGQKFVMENINYDFDKWDILPESEVELDKLVKVMKDNPLWKVELGSHTDSRGTDEYNLWLSQKRSESAVSYIVSAGIDAGRIIAKGYGESQLLNHCAEGVNCPDRLHRLNRRTEFKILGMD